LGSPKVYELEGFVRFFSKFTDFGDCALAYLAKLKRGIEGMDLGVCFSREIRGIAASKVDADGASWPPLNRE
jgi:hypothetical protein